MKGIFAVATLLVSTLGSAQIVAPLCSQNTVGDSISVSSDGTTRQSLVQSVVVPAFSGQGIRFFVGNWGKTSTDRSIPGWQESGTGLSPITITAAIKHPSTGAYIPVTFQSQNSLTLQPGEGVWCDWVDVPFQQGVAVTYQYRAEVTNPGDRFLPLLNRFMDPSHSRFANGSTSIPAAGASDLTVNQGTILQLVRPYVWQGRGFPKYLPVVVIGESFTGGTDDTPSPFAAYPSLVNGYAVRAASGLLLPTGAQPSEKRTYIFDGPATINFSVGADTLLANRADRIPRRLDLMQEAAAGPFVAWITHGINDIDTFRPVPDILADLTSFAAALRSRGAARVIATTISPKSTSTDLFTSVAGQTARNIAMRDFNQAILANPAAYGLDGVIDASRAARHDPNDPASQWRVPPSEEFVPFVTVGTGTSSAFFVDGEDRLDLTERNRYLDWVCRFTSGPLVGQVRRVVLSELSGTQHRIVVSPALASAIPAGTTGELIPVSTRDGLHPVRHAHDRLADRLHDSGEVQHVRRTFPWNVSIATAAATGGKPVSATVTNPYPSSQDYNLTLSGLSVPSQNIVIPASSTSHTFLFTTQATAADISSVVTFSHPSGLSIERSLEIRAPRVGSVTSTAASLVPDASAQVTVTLNTLAPTGGFTVNLRSVPTGALTHPVSVQIPAGSGRATFPVTALNVASSVEVRLIADPSFGEKSVRIQVLAGANLDRITFGENPTGPNRTIEGTVHLTQPAPSGGITVELRSSRASVTLPVSVTIPAGEIQGNFNIQTGNIDGLSTITASAQGLTSRSSTLEVIRPLLTEVRVADGIIDHDDSTTLTVVLSEPAPPGGTELTLSSNKPSLIVLPPSIRVPAGATSASVNVASAAINRTQASLWIYAAIPGDGTRGAQLTIRPPGTR